MSKNFITELNGIKYLLVEVARTKKNEVELRELVKKYEVIYQGLNSIKGNDSIIIENYLVPEHNVLAWQKETSEPSQECNPRSDSKTSTSFKVLLSILVIIWGALIYFLTHYFNSTQNETFTLVLSAILIVIIGVCVLQIIIESLAPSNSTRIGKYFFWVFGIAIWSLMEIVALHLHII